MREGGALIGWGMAGGVWEAMQQMPAAAKAVLTADGKLTVSSATEDIGTGTYTIMTQIAAETLGLPIEDVTFKLGDSSLPDAPVRGRVVHGRLGRLGGQGRLREGPREAVRARAEDRRLAARRRRSTT